MLVERLKGIEQYGWRRDILWRVNELIPSRHPLLANMSMSCWPLDPRPLGTVNNRKHLGNRCIRNPVSVTSALVSNVDVADE